ncbi:MAG: hypothetical protein SOR57_04600 [Parabacteroides sp.]|nr:hypothetical protein [Parabacteroides sp.]
MLYDELKAALQDSRKIRDLQNFTIADMLTNEITKLSVMATNKLSTKQDIISISWSLTEDLLNNYPDMTLEELKLCLNRGVKGYYGEYYNMDIQAIATWIRKHYKHELRLSIKKELKEEEMKKANEEKNISMSQSDIDLQYVREAFHRYKNGESLEMLRPPYIYKTLQDRGIIHHTREQKLEAMERFKDFKPTGGFNIPEHACQYIIKSQAMAWLLMQEFDKWGEMRA